MGLAKAIIVAIANTLCFLFFALSTGTSFVEIATSGRETTVGYWRTCTKIVATDVTTCEDLTSAKVNCDKRFTNIQAGRAFTLIATIVIGIMAVLSWYRIANNLFLSRATIFGKVYLVTGLVALAFGVFSWIVGFAQYSEEYCGTDFSKNTDVNKIGPSAPLGFNASVLFFVTLIIECLLADEDKKEGEGEKKEEAKKEEESKNEPAAAVPVEEEKKEEAPAATNADEEEKKEEAAAAAEKKEEEEKKDE